MRNPETSSPMQKDTIFEIHSMTKPIVSVGIMILQEQGRIFLGDPVSKYIPEFKEMKVGVESTDSGTGEKTYSEVPAKRQITVQDLLRHTSGLTYSWMGKSKVHAMYGEAGLNNPEDLDNVAKPGPKGTWPSNYPTSLPKLCLGTLTGYFQFY
jgi:CubicO group peptidase (beta-lactamase class C family)